MMPESNESNFPRISVRPGFHWDRCPAYLFDIDGTLLRSRDRVHFNAFAEGVRRVTGFEISLEGVPLAGNTDTAILAEAFRQAGLASALLTENTRREGRAGASGAAECTAGSGHRQSGSYRLDQD